MNSYEEDLEDWEKYDIEITKHIDNLRLILDSSFDEGYFSEKELIEIQAKMKMLIVQTDFWMKRNNAKRFTYDLKKFLTWLCDYVDMIEEQEDDERKD